MNQHMPTTSNTLEKLIANEKVKELALNDSGFVFSPTSGQSFSVNESGLSVLRLMQRESNLDIIVNKLLDEYQVSTQQLTQDLNEFAAHLLRNLP